MANEIFDEEMHSEASKAVDDTLRQLLEDHVIPGGGIIVSSLTVVETMTKDGHSKTMTLFTDQRTTMLLGLLQVGNMHIMSGLGHPGE